MFAIDPLIKERYPDVNLVQGWFKWSPTELDLPISPGPANPRLKIIDRNDRSSGRLSVVEPEIDEDDKKVRFNVGRRNRWKRDQLRQLSVFTTMLRTLDLFESDDSLGRRVQWATGDDPLKIYIRFTRAKDARYRRDLKGILLSYFDPDEGDRVYSCESPDIVAHETTHAIIDGIAPDLYDSAFPDCAAIHEGVCDLMAMILSFQMYQLRIKLLEQTEGDLRQAMEFGWIGEQFGARDGREGTEPYVRSLFGNYSLSDSWGKKIDRNKGYELSLILSCSVFNALIGEFERMVEDSGEEEISAEHHRLLFGATMKIKRMVCRAIDYLPPGESSLLEFAQCIIAADEIAFPNDEDSFIRDNLKTEFIKRGLANDEDFNNLTNDDFALDLSTLDELDDFDTLHNFVSSNRSFFNIPDGDFTIRNPIKTDKIKYESEGESRHKELLIKVRWEKEIGLSEPIEENVAINVSFGTTIVIDLEEKRVISRFSNSPISNRFREDRFISNHKAREISLLKIKAKMGQGVSETGDDASHQILWESNNQVLKVSVNGMGLHPVVSENG